MVSIPGKVSLAGQQFNVGIGRVSGKLLSIEPRVCFLVPLRDGNRRSTPLPLLFLSILSSQGAPPELLSTKRQTVLLLLRLAKDGDVCLFVPVSRSRLAQNTHTRGRKPWSSFTTHNLPRTCSCSPDIHKLTPTSF